MFIRKLQLKRARELAVENKKLRSKIRKLKRNTDARVREKAKCVRIVENDERGDEGSACSTDAMQDESNPINPASEESSPSNNNNHSEMPKRVEAYHKSEMICNVKPNDYTLTFVNDAFCKYFGKNKGELLGTKFDYINEVMQLTAQSPIAVIETIPSPDQVVLWTLRLLVDENGDPYTIRIIGKEIDDKKLERIESNSLFLTNMSHEIRTPMNGIIATTSLLSDTPLTTEQTEYVSTIETCTTHLLSLIGDILDFSHIEINQKNLAKNNFSIKQCISSTIHLLDYEAKKNNNTINSFVDLSIPNVVFGDMTSLRQILYKVLSNAIKFTKNGNITITVTNNHTVDISRNLFQILFSVKDTGIGIPKDKLDTVFQPFYQVDSSSTKKYGGTGLGLTICKRILNLMGNDIWIESSEGSGTTVSFNYLVNYEQDITICSSSSSDSDETPDLQQPYPLKILLVEDDPINQKVEYRMLTKLGYTVDVASSGAVVLEKLQHHTYDLIFMDLMMPEMDGLELTKRIKAIVPQKPVIIVAVTACALVEDMKKCIEVGMNDFISKPVKMQQFRAVLWKWGKIIMKKKSAELS